MKILLDMCVWGGLRESLTEAGHDVVWAAEWPKDPGDAEILERALEEGRVLITLDKDFGELAIVKRQPHGGIVRLVAMSTAQMDSLAPKVIDRYASDLEAGAIVTVEAGRIRIRPPEQE